SKIESGKFEIIPVEYDTPSLINDTAVLNIVRIGSKRITFNLHIDEALPGVLIGDELRVKQVFNNLLSNAFKYTNEGSVDWTIRAENDGDDAVWLISEVADSGIGIREEDLKKLFSDYNQVDTRSNRKIEGTGLGLSITKNLVEMMGGEISVESKFGEGSKFTVRLRQGRVNDVVIGAQVAENLRNFRYNDKKRDRSEKLIRVSLPYARVLVVDDVPTNLDVAKGMLRPYGMQVDCVPSGIEAIALIRAENVRYNAIFMDHMMPELDGVEAVRIIREEIGTEYAKTVPILALTANALAGNEEMFLKNGFQAFLSKPIDIMQLDAAVNQWVRDKEAEKDVPPGLDGRRSGSDRRTGEEDGRRSGNDRRTGEERRGQAGADWERLSADGLDTDAGLARFGGDAEVYLEVVRSYLRHTPELLETARAACAEASLPEYAVTVHGLKSSSRSIGANGLGARAEALERAAKGGDAAFVRENNGAFLADAEKLLEQLAASLETGEGDKPRKAAPDSETLRRLLDACERFDIDGVDRHMSELEAFSYESGGELTEWLRAQVSRTGFKQIAERLMETLRENGSL
ncbi:MAG: response regulator, partial [Oscillospiraceae bacterium]|nr:response regulator [Oscillospiraceae bacterium]